MIIFNPFDFKLVSEDIEGGLEIHEAGVDVYSPSPDSFRGQPCARAKLRVGQGGLAEQGDELGAKRVVAVLGPFGFTYLFSMFGTHGASHSN
ncbi:MAG TPA: hypothetical protein VIM69_10560 [Opitutaceae bacterium]